MFDTFPVLRRAGMAAATIGVAGLLFAGCTTTTPSKSSPSSTSDQRQSLDSAANATLSRLYESSSQAKELVARAKGVLVFPDVLSGSFIIGAEHGKGVLRVGGVNAGYYSTTAGSIGFQAGAQSKAMILLFMTDDALNKFRKSSGWTVGADATVAVANIGANGRIDTNTAQQPIVGFVMNNGGLMAGVSLEGTKISKLAQ
jgi:lipid-binding SYLF domain-containing protein